MQSYENMSDNGASYLEENVSVLLRRIKQGDDAAFAELCEIYKNLTEAAVTRFSPSFSGDGKSEYGRDDLGQYAAVALYKAALSYEPHTDKKGRQITFGLYAKICVNNALISVLRKHKSAIKKSGRRVGKNDGNAKNGSSSEPLDSLIFTESREELRKKLSSSLSDYETEIFDSYMTGKRVREIAEELKRDEKSVSNALYRVKAKIKGLLKNQ